jgi:hypothetical protein
MVVPLRKPACRAAWAKDAPCATASTATARRTRSRRSLPARTTRSKAARSSAVTGRNGSFCGVAMVALPSATAVSPIYPITSYLRRDPLAFQRLKMLLENVGTVRELELLVSALCRLVELVI